MSTSGPASARLTDGQLAQLAEIGEERRAEEGEVLFRIGDPSYPFMAILEGEAAVVDAAGNEIVRHPAGGFVGELSLMTGQAVLVTGIARAPMRYIAVERTALRRLMVEDAPWRTCCSPPSTGAARFSRSARASASRSSARAGRRTRGA